MPKDYNYVVARFDKDSSVTFQEFFYTESPKSFPIVYKGMSGIALGLNNPYSVQRACTTGWTDITEGFLLVEETKENNTRKEVDSESEEETESMKKVEDDKPTRKRTTKRKTTPKKKPTTRGRKKA